MNKKGKGPRAKGKDKKLRGLEVKKTGKKGIK
jgi:hypothetical protein